MWMAGKSWPTSTYRCNSSIPSGGSVPMGLEPPFSTKEFQMSIKQVLVMKSHPTDGCSDAPEIAVYPDAGELLHRVHELRALMRIVSF